MRQLGFAVGMLVWAGHAVAGPLLPRDAGDRHVGSASCAGSSCHGAKLSWQRLAGSDVRQDEYDLWVRRDAHSTGWRTLGTPESQAIADKLALGPATAAPACLACHTDAAAVTARSHTLTEGIGCEACHGGGERYVREHVYGDRSAQELVALGMYPTWDPISRALLCSSCHDNANVGHAVMGAGHPRTVFELDTFTAIQPAHFDSDEDYRARKQPLGSVRTWMLGQIAGIRALGEALADPAGFGAGPFPELARFDCEACHHPVTELRWQTSELCATPPGVPRLVDTPFWMGRAIMQVMAPQHEAPLLAGFELAQRAATVEPADRAEAAAALKALGVALEAAVRSKAVTTAQVQSLVSTLGKLGADGHVRDLALAEQTVMALGVLVSDLSTRGVLPAAADVRARLDTCHKVLERGDAFDRGALRACLVAVADAADG